MKTKTFLSSDNSVVATAIAQKEVFSDNYKVFVHWNYTTSKAKFSDGEFGSPQTDQIYTAICEWCNENNYTLWDY